MFEVVNQGAKSHLPFSPAIVAGNFVFISGQASVDPDGGTIIQDTFEGEMRRSFANMKSILEAANCGFKDVVNVRCYLNDEKDLAEFNRVYAEIFKEPYPTRSTIVGVLGTRLKFEVDCVAFKG